MVKENFCPIIKDNCKKENCMFWKEELCVFVNYFETNSIMPSYVDNEIKREENEKEDYSWIENLSNEELSNELATFKEENSPDSYWLDNNIVSLFWLKKGLKNMYSLPTEIKVKIDTIKTKAENLIDKKRDEKEKNKLDKLINDCFSWGRKNKALKLTKADVNAFLSENNESLSTDNKGILYSKVNMKLKLE